MNQTKVFCIGWHKTGTTTLGDALLSLGYTVLGARLDMAQPLLKGETDTALKLAENFDALQDVPWAALFKELDAAFPASKFILTTRDESKWLLSASKHFAGDYTVMREWLYGNGVLSGNESLYLERYRKHNADVLSYFKDRPNDLLVMDLTKGDGWEKLCPFLGKSIPEKKFPHSNKGKHNLNFKEKCIELVRKLTPMFLRNMRMSVLEHLGRSPKRDRFNNRSQNRQQANYLSEKNTGGN